jgi:hypothetical protein
MLQTQGLQLPDPYKTLRLHPHAPRELVIDAYWILVSRDRANPAPRAIDALNTSYGLLMNDADRTAYDVAHGLHSLPRPTARLVRTGLGRLGIGGQAKMVSEHADFYHVLCVDTEADGEIIGAAQRAMLKHAIRNSAAPALMRELIDEAYRTLRNPQLRAQYDALRGVATQAADGLAPAPSATAPPAPAATLPATEETPRGALPLFYRRQPPAGETARRGAEPMDAAQVRLLTLRDAAAADARNDAPGTRVALRPAEVVLGQLTFIDGPRAGERVMLGAHAVTLGAAEQADVVLGGDGVAPEHARIWWHGEHVVLRQMGDAGTRVSGQPLRMPMVLLDDDDEIEIGGHRLRFSYSVK